MLFIFRIRKGMLLMAHLVTGYAGVEHIKSADQGSYNAAFFGPGQNVLEIGNQLKANIISNSSVRILDGDILMKGRHIRVEGYEDLTIDTGSAGVSRIDLIVMTYQKQTSNGVESAKLEVIKGNPTSGTPVEPSYVDGDILNGATKNQMPLYSVRINGVSLASVSKKFGTIPTYQKLAEMYAAQFQDSIDTYLQSLSILDTMASIKANTGANHLAGALALKELNASLVDGSLKVKSAQTADSATNAANATIAGSANSVAWNSVTGKPSSYTPSAHNHDDRYFTESETNTKLNDLLVVERKDGVTGNAGALELNVAKSGYTPIGIVGYYSNVYNATPYHCYLNGTKAYVDITSAQSGVNVFLYILYRKNS